MTSVVTSDAEVRGRGSSDNTQLPMGGCNGIVLTCALPWGQGTTIACSRRCEYSARFDNMIKLRSGNKLIYGHCFMQDVIIYPRPNFNGGLTKPLLKLGHRRSIGFGDNTDILWWNNVNNQFCQLTTRVSYQRGIRKPFKCTGNHTYWGLKNNRGMQSKNGLQNLWGNTVFFILC